MTFLTSIKIVNDNISPSPFRILETEITNEFGNETFQLRVSEIISQAHDFNIQFPNNSQ